MFLTSNDKKAQLIFEWHKLKIKIQLAEDKERLYFSDKDIWWASLGVNVGHEEDGKNKKFERPVLILKKFNRYLALIIPLSSRLKENKFYYYKFFSGSQFRSAMICQIRLISSKRLIRKMGRLDSLNFQEIRRKIKNFL